MSIWHGEPAIGATCQSPRPVRPPYDRWMRITLLGTGGPRPDPERQGPAVLVEAAGRRWLFDAGRGVATQLARVGAGPEDLDAVFVTHHHFDHIGGLGDLLMAAWNNGRAQPLRVYGPSGTVDVVSALFGGVYRADIRFRIREAEINGEQIESVVALVEAHDRESGVVDLGGGFRVRVGRVEHGESALGFSDEEWSAVGYRIEGDGRTVTVTGDAVAGRDLPWLADGADVLVCCCYLSGDEIDSEANRFLAENVLAGGPQVGRIAADAGCNRLVLTHIRRKAAPMLDRLVAEIRQLYPGVVLVGEDLLTIEV